MWIKKPRVTNRPYRKKSRGNSRKTPRLVSGSPKAITSQECLENDPLFTGQSWQQWHVKDTEKGAKIVEVKHGIVYPQDENKLPMEAHHLLVVRDVLTQQLKYFLGHAPVNTSVGVLLKVAFSRWRVERCFEDEKSYRSRKQPDDWNTTNVATHKHERATPKRALGTFKKWVSISARYRGVDGTAVKIVDPITRK